MSWPPKHRILVGDVEPVELWNDAHDALNSAIGRVSKEHRASAIGSGQHKWYFTPHCSALMKIGVGAKRSDDAVIAMRTWGRWSSPPAWRSETLSFVMRPACQAVISVRTAVAATSHLASFGLAAWQGPADDTLTYVQFPSAAAVDATSLLYIEIYAYP